MSFPEEQASSRYIHDDQRGRDVASLLDTVRLLATVQPNLFGCRQRELSTKGVVLIGDDYHCLINSNTIGVTEHHGDGVAVGVQQVQTSVAILRTHADRYELRPGRG